MPQRFFPELEADSDFVMAKATAIAQRWLRHGERPNPEQRAFLERVGLVRQNPAHKEPADGGGDSDR